MNFHLLSFYYFTKILNLWLKLLENINLNNQRKKLLVKNISKNGSNLSMYKKLKLYHLGDY